MSVGEIPSRKAASPLQAARKRAGYSSARVFAETHGYNVNTYTKWEQGLNALSLDVACSLADALGCTVDEIAGRGDPAGSRQDIAGSSIRVEASPDDQLAIRRYMSLDEGTRHEVAEELAALAPALAPDGPSTAIQYQLSHRRRVNGDQPITPANELRNLLDEYKAGSVDSSALEDVAEVIALCKECPLGVSGGVRVTEPVLSFIRALPAESAHGIWLSIMDMADEPWSYGSRLYGSMTGFWRYRTGDYLVYYAPVGEVVVVLHAKRRVPVPPSTRHASL